jgi:hypothetical protein
MTDLGFGLAERRSVLIILFTFVVSTLLFGNTIPINTSTATDAFTGLVILTGFIYFFRTISRLVLILIYTLIIMPFDIYKEFRNNYDKTMSKREKFVVLATGLKDSLFFRFLGPLFQFRNWHFRQNYNQYFVHEHFGLGILGIIDRALLIIISFVSTLPMMSVTVSMVGLIGIVLLLVIYAISGRFTFILKDALHTVEEERDELVEASRSPNFPTSIYTEPKPRYDS